MTRCLLTLGIALVLAGPVRACYGGFGGGQSPPTFAVAQIDGKNIKIRTIMETRPYHAVTTALRKQPGGEVVPVQVKVTYQHLNESSITFSTDDVEAIDADGKAIDPVKLKGMLARESPVVVIQKQPEGKPDLKLLKVFRQDVPILLVPLPITGGYGPTVGGHGAAPGTVVIPEPEPVKPPKELPRDPPRPPDKQE